MVIKDYFFQNSNIMNAMLYEFLLRRVHQTGRNFTNGADADIYRSMEHAFNNLMTKTLFATQEQREYDFKQKFSKVRINVDNAIAFGVRDLRSKLSVEETAKLQAMNGDLRYNFYDKERLDEIIHDADEIFHKYGLIV